MIYNLYHKTDLVCTVKLSQHGIVQAASLLKQNIKDLPLPIKWCLKDKALIDTETEDSIILNEKGIYYVDEWLQNREIPINRQQLQKYIDRGKTVRKWMLENYAFSFTDCYWIKPDTELLSWKDILRLKEDVDEYSICKNVQKYKGNNSTLGGELEKYWYKKDNELYLCKKNEPNYEILTLREIFATLIYEKQNFNSNMYCSYEIVKNHLDGIAGCTCKAFTNLNVEIVTAWDLLMENNEVNQNNLYDKIIQRAKEKGLNPVYTSFYLDVKIIVNFLITNRDDHLGNIAFLRDSDSLNIISTAPIFDSGSSKHFEEQLPEKGLNVSVNSFESSFCDCLKHVKNFSAINVLLLPSASEYKDILLKSKRITSDRIEELVNLYKYNVNSLIQMQNLSKQNYSSKEIIEKLTEKEKLEKEKQYNDFF